MAENPAASAQTEFEEEATACIGKTLAGKYRLDGVLGSGGMAHVFRATNTVIGRGVAIKVLRKEHAANTETVERFLREARTANIVRHPNVIDVIDFGTEPDGSSFIVQELLEGETLFHYACRRQGIVPVEELSDIMGPVLSAVAEAHEQGVVHRDIKPENVFLAGQRGRRVPKVLDFGISKVLGTDMTAAGMMLGTPAYMAPEVARSSKNADPRSDVWSIGVMLFELITGKIPFQGDSVGAMFYAITTTDAAKLSDVRPDLPKPLSDVIERCLKRNANERYANARELAKDLDEALEVVRPRNSARWSSPPSGLEHTMVGQPGQAALYSRLPSRSLAVQTSGPGTADEGRLSQAQSQSQPSARVTGPTEPSGGKAGTLTSERQSRPTPTGPKEAQRPVTRAGSQSRVRARNTRSTRNTPAARHAPRHLAWTDVLAVLGVGVLLAVAILAAFRLAR